MSLDVYLSGEATTSPERWAIFIREDGETKEITREEWDQRRPGEEPAMAKVGGETTVLYSRNITHNLTMMAKGACLYEALWRPDEFGITHAHQLLAPLAIGLAKLKAEPDTFKACNPENGWGNYDGFLTFVEDYLQACIRHPYATVSVSR